MTYSDALTSFAEMSPKQQNAVCHIFNGIKAAFPDIRDAFTQAVTDEVQAIKTEMALLERQAPMVMQ